MTASGHSLAGSARRALAPETAPVLLRAGIAVLIEVAVVFVAVRSALLLAGHPDEHLTHAVLPAVFAGMFGFLGSLGGSLRGGLLRAGLLSAAGLPLTLIAIAVRDVPVAAGLALGLAALGAGALAWYGEPLATLGSVLLYLFFLPLVFGAGVGVPWRYLLLGYAVMVACNLALRAVVALVPKRREPVRVKATDEAHARRPWSRVAEPQLTRLHRTAYRSALGLGVGAFVMSVTGDHNAVWVLMTLIALIPPALPLTIDRVLQRLVGTAAAMVFLTVIDAVVPAGPLRLVVLAPAMVVTVAFMRRSYALSVVGVSTVAVLAYAQVEGSLGVALLYRGLDTVIGAAIAIMVALLIPVGHRPQAVWGDEPVRPDP